MSSLKQAVSSTISSVVTPGTLTVFSNSGSQASAASATVTVTPGYKILGGGASVSETPGFLGNMLTASYPSSIYSWTALSKDQATPDPETVTVYVIAIYDPDDLWEVQIFSATSPEPGAPHPSATVTIPAAYTLTGGGAQANFSFQGQFLTQCCPVLASGGTTSNSWLASSQDHLVSDPGTVTAYAIGIRPIMNNNSGQATNYITMDVSGTCAHPSEDVNVQAGYAMVGGGVSVTENGVGNLITASYPDFSNGVQWQGVSQDQQQSDSETLTVYAIGLQLS
jgi:hypothetical protein